MHSPWLRHTFSLWIFQCYLRILLNSIEPFAFILSPILPLHLSIPMSVVILKIASILGSVFPNISALAILLIIHILPFIGVSIYHLPYTPTMPHPRQELSTIMRPILPIVLTIPLRAVGFILAYIEIPIHKHLQALFVFLSVFISFSDKYITNGIFYQTTSLDINVDVITCDFESTFVWGIIVFLC